MHNGKLKKYRRTDPRGPLVFQTRTLGPASACLIERVVPAPADLGAGMIRVPEGSEIRLEVRLEEVSEGVLVSASAAAQLAGECSRCLDAFTSSTTVRFQELFSASGGEGDDDEYRLDGDLLDLEPALRGALVLELPLSPLCSADCAGLCVTCGVRLAEAEPGHRHDSPGGVWSVLEDLFSTGNGDAAQAATGEAGSAGAQPRTGPSTAGTQEPGEMKEH